MAYPTFKWRALGDNTNSGAGQGDDGTSAPLSGANANAPGGSTTLTLADASAGDMAAIVTDGTWAVKANGITYSIVGKNAGAKTVTTDRNTGVIAGKTWKIGGALLTLNGCSQLLGTDWQPGWNGAVYNNQTLTSAVAITSFAGSGKSSQIDFYANVTTALDINCFYPSTGPHGGVLDFHGNPITCTHGSPTASSVAIQSDGGQLTIRNFVSSGFGYFYAASSTDDGMIVIEKGTVSSKYGVSVNGQSTTIDSVRFLSTTAGYAINWFGTSNSHATIRNCTITNSVGGMALSSGATGFDRYFGSGFDVTGCTITGNSGDGIQVVTDDLGSLDNHLLGSLIANNTIAGNTGYGVNVTGTGWDATVLQSYQFRVRGVSANNTSGACNISGVVGDDYEPTIVRAGRFGRFGRV